MIHHIVLFKFSADASLLSGFLSGCASLTALDGVLSASAAALDAHPYLGYLDRAAGFTHVLQVTLRDRASLHAYDQSEVHLAYKRDCILPCKDLSAAEPLVLAVDFETPDIAGTHAH